MSMVGRLALRPQTATHRTRSHSSLQARSARARKQTRRLCQVRSTVDSSILLLTMTLPPQQSRCHTPRRLQDRSSQPQLPQRRRLCLVNAPMAGTNATTAVRIRRHASISGLSSSRRSTFRPLTCLILLRSCREGLDKPPVKRTKSKTRPAAANKGSVGDTTSASKQPSALSNAKQQPLRLQPAPSSRIILNKTAGGHFTTAQDNEDDEDMLDIEALPPLDKRSKTRAAARTDSYAAPASEETDQLDSTPSPPRRPPIESTEPRPLKVKRSLLPTDRTAEEARKRRRLSLREFASSSPIDLSNTPAVAPRSRQASMERTAESLFRRDSPGSSKATAAVRGRDEPAFDFPFSDDEPAFDDSVASAGDNNAERADVEPGPTETTLEESHEEAGEGTGGDEDDFDAWLAKSVVVM